MLAYYYHGRVYQNAEDYNQAIIAFSNAEKYAKTCEDDFYLGMIYRGMTRIYNAAYNHAEEIRYSQLAYEYFLKIDNPSYAQYAMLDIALAYHNSRDFNKCITISEDICKIAIENNNTNLLSGALRAKMSALINKKNPDSRKAADIFFYMLDSLDYQPSIKDYGLLANAYSLSNRNAEAMNIVKELKDQVRNEDKISSSLIYNIEYKVAKNVGEYKKALTLFENVTFIQDSILSKTLSQSVINTQKDYFKRQAEYDAERLRMKNTIILLIVIASVVTLASISYFWYRKVKDKEREKEFETARLMDRISEVRNELISLQREKDEQISSLAKALESENHEAMAGFREQIYRFRFFDNICRQYYSFGMTAAKQRQIFKVVEENIREVSDDKEIMALEEIVDAFRGGVMKKLRAEFPRFKEEDFKVMCYWYAGFSPTAMCVFMKVDDINDIYKRKSRLKARIEKSESPNKDFFISQLQKLRE